MRQESNPNKTLLGKLTKMAAQTPTQDLTAMEACRRRAHKQLERKRVEQAERRRLVDRIPNGGFDNASAAAGASQGAPIASCSAGATTHAKQRPNAQPPSVSMTQHNYATSNNYFNSQVYTFGNSGDYKVNISNAGDAKDRQN